MTTPAPAPLTTSSVTNIAAGKTEALVLSNIDPFSLWSLWISLSAATDDQFPRGPKLWGASIIDENTGATLLRCQVHLPGPLMQASETNSLWLGGLVLADHQSPFKLSFVTDPGVKNMWTRANGGIYYSVIAG